MAANTCLFIIEELIYQMYKDRGIVSYIYNVQSLDKTKKHHTELSKKVPMDHIFPSPFIGVWTS